MQSARIAAQWWAALSLFPPLVARGICTRTRPRRKGGRSGRRIARIDTRRKGSTAARRRGGGGEQRSAPFTI